MRAWGQLPFTVSEMGYPRPAPPWIPGCGPCPLKRGLPGNRERCSPLAPGSLRLETSRDVGGGRMLFQERAITQLGNGLLSSISVGGETRGVGRIPGKPEAAS